MQELKKEYFIVGCRLAMTLPDEYLKDFKRLLEIHKQMIEKLSK